MSSTKKSEKKSIGNRRKLKDSTSVITVRIEEELNKNLDRIKNELGISKADLIRNYLELSQCLIKQRTSLKSLNDRDFIIIKKSYLRKLIQKEEEAEQIDFGDKMAHFINDIATIKNKADNIIFKLDLCNNLGFFRKYIDEENYILISKKFGPKKFVEAFTWRLFKKKEMNSRFTESELNNSKNLKQQYNRDIHPVARSSSYYSFEFAKIPPEESE